MIREGRVTVDGVRAEIGQKVDRERVQIEIDGIPLPVQPDLVYYLAFKPAGVISTASDPQGRRTVVDLVPGETRVYPVGRLDADSEGLVLLTNDGSLTNLVTHPRYGIDKTYLAMVRGVPANRTLQRLVRGVPLEDGLAVAVTARIDATFEDRALVEIVMREGRKREIRRMLEEVGHEVVRLVRTAIGPIRDRDLAPGTFRELTLDEVRALYSAGTESWDHAPDPSETSK